MSVPSAPDPVNFVVRPGRSARALLFVVGLVAIAAIGVSAWVYTQGRRDAVRIAALETTFGQLATELAQFRVSLDLYRQQTPPITATEDADLTDLENRLAILEQSWRSGTATAPTALPAIAAPDPSGSAAATDDCLPTGTRLLVAAGDSYPICGSTATVAVLSVADGYITLQDGTTIAFGGSIPLVGTSCTLAVLAQAEDAVPGYAEIRASC